MPNPTKIYAISSAQKGFSAEEYIIRQIGDWRGYVHMMNGGGIEPTPFFRAMMQYYANGINSFSALQKEDAGGLLIATSVWGDAYIHRFLTMCLPSLLEPDNLAALKQANARIFVHTNAIGKHLIANSPVTNALVDKGILVQVMILSDEVIGMMGSIPHAKYWHLGMTQSMHLQYAKALGFAYHLMMPDFVYSAGYFDRLIKLSKDVVTHGCLSADENTIEPELNKYRNNLALSVPAPALASLSLLHTHPRSDMHFVKESKNYPRSHLLIFEGEYEVSIMSPHQTIAYLSAKAIDSIPDRIFFTLDSEIDKIVGDLPVYMPSKEDGLVASEISGVAEIYQRKEALDIHDYIGVFNQRVPEKSLHKLFVRDMALPLDRALIPDRWYMKDSEIAHLKQQLKTAICPDIPK